jgi:hypothetical protein
MANALIEDGVGRDPAPTRLHLSHRPEAFARSPALDLAVATMPRCAAGAIRHDVKAGARLMLAKPWRIQGALFGGRLGPSPVASTTSSLAPAAVSCMKRPPVSPVIGPTASTAIWRSGSRSSRSASCAAPG